MRKTVGEKHQQWQVKKNNNSGKGANGKKGNFMETLWVCYNNKGQQKNKRGDEEEGRENTQT